MTLKKLKELLEIGAITQEEYDELAKTATPEEPPKELNNNPENPKEPEESEGKDIDLDKLDRLLQAKLDKAMAKERKEKADLKKQLEKLQKAKLTDDELKQIELEQKEQAIADREKAIAEKENRLYAVKAIKEAGLDDGSETSLTLVDFVMGEDQTTITNNVKAFKKIFDKAVAVEVDKRFKGIGRTPGNGGTASNGKNPYAKETFNLTEQMRLETENPELAAQYRAASGM